MSVPQSTTLKVGEPAPDFELKDAGGNVVHLSDFRGKQHVVPAFFPFAFSRMCSAQMPSYEAELGRFNSFATQVIGISMDAAHSLAAWAKQLGLTKNQPAASCAVSTAAVERKP